MPGADEFDDFVLHVDGYLCEIKDSLIRDGLHILGAAPAGEARVNLVLAVLRANQIWGGRVGALPGLRAALATHRGVREDGARTEVDELESVARELVATCDARGWDVDGVVEQVLGGPARDVEAVLRFAATEVVPRLAAT